MLDSSVKDHYKSKPNIPDLKQHVLNAKGIWGTGPAYKTPTTVGIEVEAEKQSKGALPLLFWQVTKDGSLKDSGLEYISVPMKDEALVYALEEYDRVILKHNPHTAFSHRCSIHVHVDVTKLTVGQLRVLLATYIAVEPLFFELVAPERLGNSYCFPMADACLSWSDLAHPMDVTDHMKYCAVNPHHLRNFGTLEFRHHGGTKDKKELLEWVETILQLYRFVEKFNPLEIEERINMLNTDSRYFEFCSSVFEDKLIHFHNVDFYSKLRDNVTAAKHFLNS